MYDLIEFTLGVLTVLAGYAIAETIENYFR